MSELRSFRREAWGLEQVLFSVRLPEPDVRSRVFSAREEEYERIEALLLDAPHNILLSGIYGVGKTIFIRELLDRMQRENPDEVLAIYECLDNTETDLLTTILRGLARALSKEDDEAHRINQILAGVELVTQSTHRGSGGGEINLAGLAKLARGGEDVVAETWARKVVPNAAYQTRELVRRAVEIPWTPYSHCRRRFG